MKYSEKKMNLFSVSDDYYLAQCISADLGMGKGIAVQFNKHFDMKNKMIKKYGPSQLTKWDKGYQGTCVLIDRVFNLITKRNYWLKPTYTTLTSALIEMRNIAVNTSITKIAMPLIGCGLDRLEWNEVSSIIKHVFADTNIEILICKQ